MERLADEKWEEDNQSHRVQERRLHDNLYHPPVSSGFPCGALRHGDYAKENQDRRQTGRDEGEDKVWCCEIDEGSPGEFGIDHIGGLLRNTSVTET
jgi:hypothetical protein